MMKQFVLSGVRAGLILVAIAVAFATHGRMAAAAEWKSGIVWPQPPIIDPGPIGGPPSDAVVLFDGTDLSQWDGGDKWEIKDGYAVPRGGGIQTKDSFGDCQLHVEWVAPEDIKGTGQGRGNSGVYMMGKYEVQILDSYENETYFDGQCGAIYKQSPPMVNACRKPGEWQTFDILFTSPRFEEGKLTNPGHLTVLHNGVAIQNHFALKGGTAWHKPPEYQPHPPKGPIHLQFHGNPVQFRNIWVRELKPIVGKTPGKAEETDTQPAAEQATDKVGQQDGDEGKSGVDESSESVDEEKKPGF
jgi:hypothetical protein